MLDWHSKSHTVTGPETGPNTTGRAMCNPQGQERIAIIQGCNARKPNLWVGEQESCDRIHGAGERVQQQQ